MDARAEAEFKDFVEARWHRLLRAAYLMTGDHGLAEDLLQTALVRAHRHWHRIERRDAPEVYVRRVMVNLDASWWRRGRVREHLVAAAPDVAGRDRTADVDLHDQLWRACLTLPPRMRAVLVLRYFEDLAEAEVAAVLGCSVGTVKSQASRGLARLRELLDAAERPATTPVTNGSPA